MTFVFYTVVVFQWIVYPQMVLNKFSKELWGGGDFFFKSLYKYACMDMHRVKKRGLF